MSRKHSKDHSSSDSSEEGVEDIAVQIEKLIKEVPDLHHKLQLVALNGYMQEKIKLDQEEEAANEMIEIKYRKQLDPILVKINEIIEGKRDLTPEDFVGVSHLLTEEEQLATKDYLKASKFEGYWLKTLQNSFVVEKEIYPNDVPILKHLERLEANKSDDATHLSLAFYFSDNEWFSNKCLRKEFDIGKEGVVLKTYGDAIDWKEGKNITVKIVAKKQKNKKTGQKKVSTKEVKEESFFHFFKAINVEELEEQDDEEEEGTDGDLAQLQYEIAEEIYDPIVVRSLEAYLGTSLGFEAESESESSQQSEKQDKKKNSSKQKQHSKRKDSNKPAEKSQSKQKSKSKSKDKKKANQTESKPEPKAAEKKPNDVPPKDPTKQAMKEECKQQ